MTSILMLTSANDARFGELLVFPVLDSGQYNSYSPSNTETVQDFVFHPNLTIISVLQNYPSVKEKAFIQNTRHSAGVLFAGESNLKHILVFKYQTHSYYTESGDAKLGPVTVIHLTGSRRGLGKIPQENLSTQCKSLCVKKAHLWERGNQTIHRLRKQKAHLLRWSEKLCIKLFYFVIQ